MGSRGVSTQADEITEKKSNGGKVMPKSDSMSSYL